MCICHDVKGSDRSRASFAARALKAPRKLGPHLKARLDPIQDVALACARHLLSRCQLLQEELRKTWHVTQRGFHLSSPDQWPPVLLFQTAGSHVHTRKTAQGTCKPW